MLTGLVAAMSYFPRTWEPAMSFRFPVCFRFLAIPAVFLVMSGCSYADDPATVKQLQETVAKLEKKIADLEAKVVALEKQGKPSNTEEEYVKQKGAAILDAMLAGDGTVVRGSISVKLLKGIDSFWEVGSLNHNAAVDKWIGNANPKKQYKSHHIDKVVFSPAKDEVVLSGTVHGKNPADQAVDSTFTMTLVKEKDKYLLDAFAIKEK
jgi:hypothetical protein